MSSTKESEIWVVLHCEKDDSHVLVTQDAVIYDGEKLKVNDEVRFDFPGEKSLLTGLVKGSSGDKKSMIKLQDRLNLTTRPKREPSFDADKPRRAAMKCKEKVVSSNSRLKTHRDTSGDKPACGPVSSTLKTVAPSSSILRRVLDDTSRCVEFDSDNSNASSDDNSGNCAVKYKSTIGGHDIQDLDDSCSSEEELTPEEKILLEKLSMKKQAQELKVLLALSKKRPSADDTANACKKVQSDQGDIISSIKAPSKLVADVNISTMKGTLKLSESTTTKKDASSPENTSMTSGTLGTWKTDSTSSKMSTKESSATKQVAAVEMVSVPRRQRGVVREIIELQFVGEHFHHKSTDEKVVKLWDDYDVYVTEQDMKKIKSSYTSSTSLARALVRMVFTPEARESCSVSGKPSMVRGQEKPEKRTALHKDGVDAITAFVSHRSQKKGWKCPSDSFVKQAMGNMLCEERAAARAHAEAKEAAKSV